MLSLKLSADHRDSVSAGSAVLLKLNLFSSRSDSGQNFVNDKKLIISIISI